jgi:hypothetical protein
MQRSQQKRWKRILHQGLTAGWCRAAALAGCGQGRDAADLDDKSRAGFPWQALEWLQAERKAWHRLLEQEPGKASAVAHNSCKSNSVTGHREAGARRRPIVDPARPRIGSPSLARKLKPSGP